MAIYEYPKSIPGSNYSVSESKLRIVLDVMELKSIAQLYQGEGSLNAELIGETFKFIAPNQITENIIHQWENQESKTSKHMRQRMVWAWTKRYTS